MTSRQRPTRAQARAVFRQAFAYLVVGGLSAGIDAGLYTLFIWLGVNPVIASPTSFLSSVLFNYFLNRAVVFSDSRPGTYWRYALVVAFNVALGTGIVAAGIAFGLHPLVAKAVSMVVIVAFNFVVLRTWVFSSPKGESDAAADERDASA